MKQKIEDLSIWCKNFNILYVEDDEVLREELGLLLSDIFGHTTPAKDGQDGLKKFQQNSYDIVMTDIRMPIMNGIELAKKIRNTDQNTPIIVLSAHNESNYLIELIEIGIENFLTKPLDSHSLINTLHSVVEKIYNKRQLEYYKKGLEDVNKLLQQKVKLQKIAIDSSSFLIQEYQNAIDKTSIIIKTDSLGRITHLNRNFCNATGYSESEMIGKDKNILLKNVDKKNKEEILDAFSRKKYWQGSIKLTKSNLKNLQVYLNIAPILNQEQEIVEFLLIIQNIDTIEQKSQEKMNKISSQASIVQNQHLLDLFPTPAFLVDNDMHIIETNKIFKQLCTQLEDPMALLKLEDKTLTFLEVILPIADNCINRVNENLVCSSQSIISCSFELHLAFCTCEVLLKMKRKDENSFLVMLVLKEDESCFQL